MDEPIEQQEVGEERKEFLEHRASGIGATDTPKILGLSKWGSALSVYNEKIGAEEDRGPSLYAWLGQKLQATVGELYTAATGIRLRADNRHHRHSQHDWLVCHLDFRAWGRPELLVEAKTRSRMAGFGEDGSGIVPPDVWAQVQHEMAVTGASEAHVAVLFGHHTYRTYRIARDGEFIAAMIPRLEEFWFGNVKAGIAPEPTGHPEDSRIVRSENPEHDETIIPATPEEERLIEAYGLASYNVTQAENAKAEAANRLIRRIGSHLGIQGAAGTVTFRRTKDTTKVSWQEIAQSQRAILDKLIEVGDGKFEVKMRDADDMVLEFTNETLDAIESLYTEEKPGYRRINYTAGTS